MLYLLKFLYSADAEATAGADTETTEDANVVKDASKESFNEMLKKVQDDNNKKVETLKEEFKKELKERDNIISQLMKGEKIDEGQDDKTPQFVKKINEKRERQKHYF
mgnify:CR=1 FL=1